MKPVNGVKTLAGSGISNQVSAIGDQVSGLMPDA
jgi:hypothetical protein